jgi:hypothetical protein
MCILRDLPQQKNPRLLRLGELPQFYMFPCSYENISSLFLFPRFSMLPNSEKFPKFPPDDFSMLPDMKLEKTIVFFVPAIPSRLHAILPFPIVVPVVPQAYPPHLVGTSPRTLKINLSGRSSSTLLQNSGKKKKACEFRRLKTSKITSCWNFYFTFRQFIKKG